MAGLWGQSCSAARYFSAASLHWYSLTSWLPSRTRSRACCLSASDTPSAQGGTSPAGAGSPPPGFGILSSSSGWARAIVAPRTRKSPTVRTVARIMAKPPVSVDFVDHAAAQLVFEVADPLALLGEQPL